MVMTSEGQPTTLSSLIAQSPYQVAGPPDGVTVAPAEPGVTPAADPAGQGPANEGQSPVAGNDARPNQTVQQGQGVTPQDNAASGGNDLPSSDDAVARRAQELEQLVREQSITLGEAQRQLQHYQQAQFQAARQRQDQAFLASIADLPDEERQVRIAQREAWEAKQQLMAERQRSQMTERQRQEEAKHFVAVNIAADVGLPLQEVAYLLQAQTKEQMEQIAQQRLDTIRGYGYNPDLPVEPQQVGQMQQQGERWLQPMGQQQQELPSPSLAGVGTQPQGTLPEKPANGSGNLLGLIQATQYQPIRS